MVATVNNPRRHHFVPRFYLAGFCPDSRDTLAVYDRARNAYRAQRPAELAHRRDFYAYEDEEGNRYFDIEAGLGEIEAATRAVIQRIDAEEPLEVDDRHTLATYAGFQYARTPVFKAMYDTLFRHHAERVTNGLQQDQETIAQELRGAGVPLDDAMSREQLGALAEAIAAEPDRTRSLGAMLRIATRFAAVFTQMQWTLWRRPSERTSFVTTDSPFCTVATRPPGEGVYGGVGILSPDSVSVLPLSQGSCLAMSGVGGAIAHRRLGTAEVRRVNLNVVRQCQHFVFGRDMRQVEHLVQATGIDIRPWQLPLRIS
ncbi:DUF4238 domain-containing protein [Ralstonia pseudosolanacearum]